MKVDGRMDVKIDIDESEQHKITEKFLYKLFGYNTDMYINDKEMLAESWEDGGGSHSWIETKDIRKATKEDKVFFDFMVMLHKKWREQWSGKCIK